VNARPGAEILDEVARREPFGEHDGRSGASLERVRLRDDTRLIVKRFDPDEDLLMRITNDEVGREFELWRDGHLDGFPDGVEHPIRAGWRDGRTTVLAMRDLGDAVLTWDRTLTRAECRWIFAAMIGVHRSCATRSRPAGACSIETRTAILSPQRVEPFATGDHGLPAAVLRGWERFHDLVPPDVGDTVASIHAHPEILARRLAERPGTLLHGDLFLVNIALDETRVSFFDWGLATWGPSWLEMTMFLIGAMSNVDATHEQLLDDYRELSGADHDELAFRLALLCTLCDLGWNKALDAADHDDPAKRAREAAELEWWVAQARQTLDAGLL
jgi:hypothetical protein